MLEAEFRERLAELLSRRTVLVGVGQMLRGDDAVGLLVVRELAARCPSLICVDAGANPENHVGIIARHCPEVVVLVDALDLGEPPGRVALLNAEQLADLGSGTHGFPLPLVMAEIRSRTSARVSLLGIQPESLRFGEALSPAADLAVKELTSLIAGLGR